MKERAAAAQDLMLAVQGDLAAFARLARRPNSSLERCRATLPELVLTTDAVVRVLRALRDDATSPADAQRWGSFVRRGFLPVYAGPPMRAICIDYDDAAEQQIADAVSRLDELGEAVDGLLDGDELDQLIASLSLQR